MSDNHVFVHVHFKLLQFCVGTHNVQTRKKEQTEWAACFIYPACTIHEYLNIQIWIIMGHIADKFGLNSIINSR